MFTDLTAVTQTFFIFQRTQGIPVSWQLWLKKYGVGTAILMCGPVDVEFTYLILEIEANMLWSICKLRYAVLRRTRDITYITELNYAKI